MRDPLDLQDRLVLLDGCTNFRDLGGYRTADGRVTRRGSLFRSDRLAELTSRDVRTVRELGVRTIIDLRRSGEIEDGARTRLGAGTRYVHASLNREDSDGAAAALQLDGLSLASLYVWMAEGARPGIRTVCETLADADGYPAVFHCWGGKDRTGIIAALLLAVAGVDDVQIVADYAFTQQRIDSLSEESRRAAFEFVDREGMPRAVLDARAESMEGFLVQLRATYGSIEGFLASCAVSEGVLADITDRIVAP